MAVFEVVYGSGKVRLKWAKVPPKCGVNSPLPSRHFRSFIVKVKGLQTSQKVLLKLNPRPKTARVATMMAQNDLPKVTQNHSKRRETGHYKTQNDQLLPQRWFPSQEKWLGNFLRQAFRNLTWECHVLGGWNGCKNAQMLQAKTNNKDNELLLNNFKLEMKTNKTTAPGDHTPKNTIVAPHYCPCQ